MPPPIALTSPPDADAKESSGRETRRRLHTTKSDEDAAGQQLQREADAKDIKGGTKKLVTLLIKSALHCEQQCRDIKSVIFDTFIVKSDSVEYNMMSEQTSCYDREVKKKGKEHDLGPPYIGAFFGGCCWH